MKQQNTRALTMIPLNQLKRSALNVRKTAATCGIEELAAMIAAQGLLQNLTVIPCGAGMKTAYEVVAGGRRLAALQKLAKAKSIPATYGVPCLVVPREQGVELSLAENSGREAMHPADQFEAFRALIDAGTSIEDVAAHFGVTPLTVQRRLKLANVAPRFIGLYRSGKVDMDTLMALALVEDHAQQETLWDGLKDWQRSGHAIRDALMGAKLAHSHRLAKFVGVKAYEKAGGAVERDLFSDTGECYLSDVALVHKLVAEKLAKAAEGVRAEGCAWVELREEMDYSERSTFGRVVMRTKPATKAQQVKIEKLEAELAELEKKLDDADEDTEQALFDRQEQIEETLEEIEESRREADPEQQAKAGALVTIDHSGKLEIIRGLLKPADAKAFRRSAAASSEPDATPAAGNAGHSDAMLRRLAAHRTRALQIELARRPDVALIATVHALVVATFYEERWAGAINVQAQVVRLEHEAPDLATSEADAAMKAEAIRWREQLPPDVGELWGWLQQQPQDVLLALLAFCVAGTASTGRGEADALARAVNLDMHRWWKPTADAYFNAMPKARILETLPEIADDKADMKDAEKLKKTALAEHAAKLAQASGWQWLPEPMRVHAA